MKKSVLLGLGALVVGIMSLTSVQLASAATLCSTDDLTTSVACLDGILNDNNDDASYLNAAPGYFGSTDWVFLQKIEYIQGGGQDNTAGGFDVGLDLDPDNAASSGTWAFTNSPWGDYDNIVIVLKDGGIPPGPGDKTYWFAYLLENGITNGDWSYPEGRELSHISVYGQGDGSGSGGGDPIPEPGTMLLLGTGLLGLAGVGRRSRKG